MNGMIIGFEIEIAMRCDEREVHGGICVLWCVVWCDVMCGVLCTKALCEYFDKKKTFRWDDSHTTSVLQESQWYTWVISMCNNEKSKEKETENGKRRISRKMNFQMGKKHWESFTMFLTIWSVHSNWKFEY